MSEGVRKEKHGNSTDRTNTLHYLGPPGTYSHQVALELIQGLKERTSKDVALQPCETIKSTIQEATKRVQEVESTFWSLLPYENNSNGPVTDSYDVLFALNATSTRIIGEFHLPVNHSLMCSRQVYNTLKGNKDGNVDLKKLDIVSSHSQALGQCSIFLQSRLRSGVELHSTTSTGEAAKQLKGLNGEKLHACISSRVCARADVYDLVILQEGIQNSDNNMTRFLLLETSKVAEDLMPQEELLPQYRRAMVRIETSAASRALTVFINKLTMTNSKSLECHVRSIERRAKKDAVDDVNGTDLQDEGHWPFVYLIEVEGRSKMSSNGHQEGNDTTSKPSKRARKEEEEEEIDFSQHLSNALSSVQFSEASNATAICLGNWPILQTTR